MITLLYIHETFSSGFRPEALFVFSLTSILSAILVIVSKNPIVSVLFLIGLFLSIACYLLILGINFIGISYLLVYVGAVSILFLFILMLINVRVSELISDTSSAIPLALIIALSFSFSLYDIITPTITSSDKYSFISIKNILSQFIISENYAFSNIKNEIEFVTSNFWDGTLAEAIHITSIGNVMYTSYSMWLIITSIILLLAMVGAIIITIKQEHSMRDVTLFQLTAISIPRPTDKINLQVQSLFFFGNIRVLIINIYKEFLNDVTFYMALFFIVLSHRILIKFMCTCLGTNILTMLVLCSIVYALANLIKSCKRNKSYEFCLKEFAMDIMWGFIIAGTLVLAGSVMVSCILIIIGQSYFAQDLRLCFFGKKTLLPVVMLEGNTLDQYRPEGITDKQYSIASKHAEYIMGRLEFMYDSLIKIFALKQSEEMSNIDRLDIVKVNLAAGYPFTYGIPDENCTNQYLDLSKALEYFKSLDRGLRPSPEYLEAYTKCKNTHKNHSSYEQGQ